MKPTLPPIADPDYHGWAELLQLVGALRQITHDRTLSDADAVRRARDLFAAYDHADPEDES